MKSDRVRAFATVLAWALFWAMAAGLAHVGSATIKFALLGKFAGAERDYVWMIPLGYVLSFGILAVPAAAFAALLPSRFIIRAAAATLAFFGGLGILLLFPRIHPAASALLAAGIGIRVSLSAKPLARKAGIAGLSIAAILTVVALTTSIERRATERATLARLGTARAGAPNVLLIILDTVRAANMNFLGYARRTAPRITALAAGGVTFEQAYSTASWTLASHAAFFTGRYGSQLNVDWEIPLDRSNTTVAEVFQRNGYATAGFVANRFYTSWDSGLARGFGHYDDTHVTLRQVMLSTTFAQTTMMRSIVETPNRRNVVQNLRRMDLHIEPFPSNDLKTAEVVGAQFLHWLPKKNGRPFFAFINLFDAHRPYTSPQPRRFSANPKSVDLYDAAIFHMDSVIGVVIDSLEARGLLENTIVIVTSDHGEELGEHGLEGHGKSLYRNELHVPLVVSSRGIDAGLRVGKAVTLRDLPMTMLDLAGITGSGFPGVSLRQAWAPAGAPGSQVISEVTKRIRMEPDEPSSRGDMRSILDDTSHFIVNGDGAEELYDWRVDLGEQRNLAAEATSRERVQGMRTRMDSALSRK